MDERKVCVITGALGALGIPTATELARRGYHVVLLGRGPERLAQARARVAKESGTGSVDTCECDLGSFQSIRAAAKRLGERYPKIHLLINNAAVYSAARKLSADGCELMVAVNHLAPFLLTLSLEAPLTAAGDARVICMTMASGKPAALDDLMSERRFSAFGTFVMSKGLGHYFVRELAERWRGRVAVYAVDPKMTRTTLVREAPLPLRILFALFAASPEKSRDLVVRAATAPELAGQSGIYLTRKPRETFSPHSDDAGARGRLWELSAERVGIAAHPPAIAVVG